jgi:hypothetical protein
MLNGVIREALGWLQDCGNSLAAGRPDRDVIWLVHVNVEGGWPAFVKLDPTVDHKLVCAELTTRFGAVFAHRIYGDRWEV